MDVYLHQTSSHGLDTSYNKQACLIETRILFFHTYYLAIGSLVSPNPYNQDVLGMDV